MDESFVYAVGIVSTRKGASPQYVDGPRRYKEIWGGLQCASKAIRGYAYPRNEWEIYAEAPGGSKSVRAACAMASSQALLSAFSADQRVDITFMLPKNVKKIICLDSSATKDDVRNAVVARYPGAEQLILDEVGRARGKTEHIYDAIAIGWAIHQTKGSK